MQAAEKVIGRPVEVSLREPASLKAQLRILWRERLLIGAVTALCGLGGVAAAFLLPRQYEATTMLSVVTNRAGGGESSGALGSLATALGGLSELAGVESPTETQRNEALAVLESAELTEKYISDNHLLPVLYAKYWNPNLHSWTVHDPEKLPDLWKANKYFNKKVRKVTTSGKTGLVTLQITWKDPRLAATWANGLVKLANDYLRDKAIAEAERNIRYLDAAAAKTNTVEERDAIYTVMTTEINKAMLARGSDEYAFRVLDPAQAPETPSYPRRMLWSAGGFAGGLFLGVFFAFIRTAWRESL